MSADLFRVFEAGEQVKRWAAERENASARHDLAKTRHASATLLSRADPVSHLGMNREHLRVLLAFLAHNDLPRLLREVQNMAPDPVPQAADRGVAEHPIHAYARKLEDALILLKSSYTKGSPAHKIASDALIDCPRLQVPHADK